MIARLYLPSHLDGKSAKLRDKVNEIVDAINALQKPVEKDSSWQGQLKWLKYTLFCPHTFTSEPVIHPDTEWKHKVIERAKIVANSKPYNPVLFTNFEVLRLQEKIAELYHYEAENFTLRKRLAELEEWKRKVVWEARGLCENFFDTQWQDKAREFIRKLARGEVK